MIWPSKPSRERVKFFHVINHYPLRIPLCASFNWSGDKSTYPLSGIKTTSLLNDIIVSDYFARVKGWLFRQIVKITFRQVDCETSRAT